MKFSRPSYGLIITDNLTYYLVPITHIYTL
jgi:hypothetical protein